MDDMLTDSIEPLLVDCCSPAVVRAVEEAPGCEAGRSLWHQVDELGFLDALVSEEAGGAGLDMRDVAGVLYAFGRYAMPFPVAHTMIARRLLADAGVAIPPGPIALTVSEGGAEASGGEPARVALPYVPYGKVCQHFLIERSDGMWLIDIAATEAEQSVIKHSLDVHLRIKPGAGVQVGARTLTRRKLEDSVLLELGAIATATTMAGAMARIVESTIVQVNDRQQFGRSIGKFQAVQQTLSVMAEHACAAQSAAKLGCRGAFSPAQRLRGAVAKSRASRAAPLIANSAHALAGAMGITEEYDLQLYTRRLHAERLHFGAESFWDGVIGSYALDNWDTVVEGVVSCSS